MGIEVSGSWHTSWKEQHIGIAVIVVGKHGVGQNANTMSTPDNGLIGTGHGLDGQASTTAYVDRT